jgi:hypothetical protein
MVDSATRSGTMETHHQQIRAAPQRPVTVADRDVAALIGVLAILEGRVLSGEASPHMTRQLSDRLTRYGLLSAGAASQPLAGALHDLNQRLRVARGEYDGMP